MRSFASRFGTSHAVALATLLVLVCTGLVLRASSPAVLAETFGPPAGVDARQFHAVVVLQAEDCESATEFLKLFQRPAVRPNMTLAAVVLGSRDEYGVASSRLAVDGVPSLRRGGFAAAVSLRSLGFRSTPFIVVFDRRNQVRYAAEAPHGYAEYQRLASFLTWLSSGDT